MLAGRRIDVGGCVMVQESEPPIVRVQGISKTFPAAGGLFARHADPVIALSDVSLEVAAGRTLAVVGESGSGKTTLGRCIAGIHNPSSGSIFYRGQPISRSILRRDRKARRAIQMIFQDPAASLNPRQRVGRLIGEPLAVHAIVPPDQIARRVEELLDAVGLGATAATKFPHEFSGGQKQRVAIARALSMEPEVLICDEAVSALDVSVQAQIVNLLKDLQRERRLTYLFISHDMAVVRHIADAIAVMQSGRLVELGETEALFRAPRFPYTRSLLDAVPRGISLYRSRN